MAGKLETERDKSAITEQTDFQLHTLCLLTCGIIWY